MATAVCQHGQLDRSCRICELEFDLADATACYNRQMEKRLSAEWFAKAWKRAAKELKRKHSNQSSTIGALLKKRERFHAALTQCFLFVPNAHQTNVYIDEPELLVKDVRALKAKIEALLCEFENAAAMSTQKRTAEWFLRRAREHFGEGK